MKSEEAKLLAVRLARATGETITAAVTQAIRERLAALEAVHPTADELLGIGRDCASRLTEPWRSMPIDMLLYDEGGLPPS